MAGALPLVAELLGGEGRHGSDSLGTRGCGRVRSIASGGCGGKTVARSAGYQTAEVSMWEDEQATTGDPRVDAFALVGPGEA